MNQQTISRKSSLARSISLLLAVLMTVGLMPATAWQTLASPLQSNKTLTSGDTPTEEEEEEKDTSAPEVEENPFMDVPEGSWYHDFVLYAYENSLFFGVTADQFDPFGSMTRGMFVTVLGSGLAQVNKEDYGFEDRFTDIKPTDYYAPYVQWAVDHKITLGTSETTFSPKDIVTREQMAVFIVSYFYDMGYSFPKQVREDLPLDFELIATYAQDAVTTLWQCGMISGFDESFLPKNPSTRSEVAAFAYQVNAHLVKLGVKEHIPMRGTEEEEDSTDSDSSGGSSGGSSSGGSSSGGSSGGGSSGGGSSGGDSSGGDSSGGDSSGDSLDEDEGEHDFEGIPEQGVDSPEELDDGEEKEEYLEVVLSEYCDIALESNGGTLYQPLSLKRGDVIETLPTPYKLESIFVGWYYDAGLTQMVDKTDVITQEVTLYAKYQDVEPMEEVESTPMAVALDASSDFSVTVVSATPLTLEEFKDLVTCENLGSSEDKEWFHITQGDTLTTFTIRGYHYGSMDGNPQSGFEEGSVYKITLESDVLTFEGKDASTRVYDFSIYKEEVNNLQMSATLKQVSIHQISDLVVNGKPQTTISLPVITVGDGKSNTGITKGSFTYSGEVLEVGDSVVVYSGTVARSVEEVLPVVSVSQEENAFIQITEVDGTTYSYETANPEDVLFIPDVLPVDSLQMVIGEEANHFSIFVEEMTYYEDHFAGAGLDATTTIDVGDFIAVYSGSLEDTGELASISGEATQVHYYGEILSVEELDGSYYIHYNNVSLDQLQQAMSVFQMEDVDGETLLEGVDVEHLEETIRRQAIDSGFVEEAALHLASLATETESFTTLSEEMGLKTYEMRFNGEEITQDTLARMGAKSVDWKISYSRVKIGTKLEHFDDAVDGLYMELGIGIVITMDVGDEGEIEITVEAAFRQETRISLVVNGDAQWSWWGIIPYISEYEVMVQPEFYTYTGISLTSVIASGERNPDGTFSDIFNVSDELSKLIENLSDSAEFSSSLEERYVEMLDNETDWINLVEQELMKMKINILLVIEVQITVKVSIDVDVNIALGMTFEHKNAKRYIYHIQVFARNVSNNVINLQDDEYTFQFYVVGCLGLRAGINVEVLVGFLSTDLAGVGFAAEVGPYVRLYGYFFYELTNHAQLGRKSTASGALLVEFGIYLEVNFVASAIGGLISCNPTLYDDEWALLTAGSQENVRDFAYHQVDVPEIAMKAQYTTMELPSEVFEMAYLDLLEGLDGDELFVKNFETATVNGVHEEFFTLTFSNENFSYNPHTNYITVTVPSGSNVTEEEKLIQEGELLLTWNAQPLTFTSQPITRTVPVSWDNLRSGYVIVPFTNGGSFVPIVNEEYEDPILVPENPRKTGYLFDGWYTSNGFTQSYTFPETMPNTDAEIFAKWKPATDTVYTVEHHLQVLGSTQYQLAETEKYTGTTDSTVTPQSKTFQGYVSPTNQKLEILPDGSAIVRYYYDLKAFKLTFKMGLLGGDDLVQTLKYSAPITTPQINVNGYVFEGWKDLDGNTTVKTNMLEYDQTYTAQWSVDTSATVSYRVEHYLVEGGQQRLQHIEYRKWSVDSTDQLSLPLSAFPDWLLFPTNRYDLYLISVDGLAQDADVVIHPSGSTVVKVNYTSKEKTLTLKLDNGESDRVISYLEGDTILTPEPPTKIGYSFTGWLPALPSTMGGTALVSTAQWTVSDKVPYKVHHYQQNANDPSRYTLFETEVLEGSPNTTVATTLKEYDHFTAKTSNATMTPSLATDGSTQVSLYYDRDQFTLTYLLAHSVHGVTTNSDPSGHYLTSHTGTYRHGQTINLQDVVDMNFYDSTYGGLFTSDSWANSTLFTGIMPTEDSTLYVRGMLDGTSYTLSHRIEQLDGSYKEVTVTQSVAGNGTYTAPTYYLDASIYEIPSEKQVTVQNNHPTLVYSYPLKEYDITWDYGDATCTNLSQVTQGSVKYGSKIVAPILTKAGHIFTGWDKEVQEEVGMEDQHYVATWYSEEYTLSFDTTMGVVPDSMDFIYGDSLKLPNMSAVLGYSFRGWVYNGVTYSGGSDFKHSNASTKEIKMVASWVKNTYSITYHVSQSHGNPSSYNVDSRVDLKLPTLTGHDFSGWYTSSDFAPSSFVDTIYPGSVGSLNLYGKWTPKTFVVTFDDNTQSNHRKTQTFTYGVSEALRTYQSLGFSLTGNIFLGWNTSPDGTGTSYTTAQSLTTTHPTTLYAQWKEVVYTVSYRAGEPLSGTNPNPTTYTVSSGDIFLESVAGKEGYTFLGWYDDNGKEVTSINKGSTGNLFLTAKWSHAGTFSVVYKSSSTTKDYFQIVRTIPEDAVASSDPQYVYYRTVNGSEFGDAHFTHVGGENIYVIFNQSDGNGSVKSIEVTRQDPTKYNHNGSTATITGAYLLGGYASTRYYTMELYRVTNTLGGAQGILSSTASTAKVTRYYSSSRIIPSNYYSATKLSTVQSGSIRVTDSFYFSTSSGKYVSLPMVYNQSSFSNYSPYFIQNNDTLAVTIQSYISEYDDGYQYMRYANALSSSSSYYKKTDFKKDTKGNGKGSSYYSDSVTFQGSAMKNGMLYITLDASGYFDDDFSFSKAQVTSTKIVPKTTTCTQLGIAPMAYASYKAGETITISVVYDRLITSTSSVSLGAISGLSYTNAKLVGGVGTNVLTFTATVTKDYTVNNAVLCKVKPVSGTVTGR